MVQASYEQLKSARVLDLLATSVKEVLRGSPVEGKRSAQTGAMTGIVKCGLNLSPTSRHVDLPDGPFERSWCPKTGVVYGRDRESTVSRADLWVRTLD